ncbi:MAG: MaoC/PaaZ C-terminal domain-containing protein [Verrucomicrobiota bacterium]
MTYDDFQIDYEGTYTKVVTELDNDRFAELSGDYNPIHFDEAVGKRCGFKGRVSNGFVAESRIAAALVETFGTETLIVLALRKNTKFLKPVYMGDTITATVKVVARQEDLNVLKIEAKNLPRSLPPRDAVYIKNRFRAHLGFSPN